MSEESIPDLARIEAWCGVRPGMTRAQVRAALQQQGAEVEDYGDDALLVTTEDWEMEFYFATDGSERLRQLAIVDGEIRWAGQPLMNARLDTALRALETNGPAVGSRRRHQRSFSGIERSTAGTAGR